MPSFPLWQHLSDHSAVSQAGNRLRLSLDTERFHHSGPHGALE